MRISLKRPIEWHEECFKNQSEYYDKKKKQLETLRKELVNDYDRLVFYEDQIKLAKIMGLEGFDPIKFNVKRKSVNDGKESKK